MEANPSQGRERELGALFSSELWWRDRYYELEKLGYRLRSRYRPSWVPSWRGTRKAFFAAEDGQPTLLRAVMDAERISDHKQVMLKKVLPEEGPHELTIAELVSSAESMEDRRNHCVQLIQLIELSDPPGQKLMVMPLLRFFNNPHFQTYGEFVSFFTQICDGVHFLHERNIAHRDCTTNNIMLDPSGMYPQGFHPVQINRRRDFKGRAKRRTRTETSPRYYLIDFGLSRKYGSRDALDEPLRGGDKTAPEHEAPAKYCNPFPTDIYYLGNLVREEFLRASTNCFFKYRGFEFMEGLVNQMTDKDPAKRPRIEEVVATFDSIRTSLTARKLRSAITSRKDPALFTAFRYARQTLRTIRYLVARTPAIPKPT
ncbi:kinase-like domain-containing protein [Gloeopeniophorella convolvens]|nr:kinase-like domain-containing protein [Gloeopeniophorella convolvens]